MAHARPEPGQFYTLETPFGPRSYSVSRIDGEEVELAVKVIPGGRGSRWMSQRRVGQTLSLLGPFGNFVIADDSEADSVHVLVAGGIGITPCLAMARDLVRRAGRLRLILVTTNSSAGSSPLRADLLHLFAQRPAGALWIEHFTQTAPMGELIAGRVPARCSGQGRLTPETLRDALNESVSQSFAGLPVDRLWKSAHFYTCGPAGLMDTVRQMALQADVAPERVLDERFERPAATLAVPSEAAWLELASNQQRYRIRVPAGLTLFEAISAGGLEAGHGCLSGACGRCEWTLVAGAALSLGSAPPQRIEPGSRLRICLAVPASATVGISDPLEALRARPSEWEPRRLAARAAAWFLALALPLLLFSCWDNTRPKPVPDPTAIPRPPGDAP